MPKVRIFVSYAREECHYLGYRQEKGQWIKDEDCPRALIPWLAKSIQLRHPNTVFWCDWKELTPADDFRKRIETEIDQAHIAVLLLSSGFLISDFIKKVELPRIRDRVNAGCLRIISILAEPSRWEDIDFVVARLILPRTPASLVDFESDKEWAHVRDEILRSLEHVIKQVEDELLHGKVEVVAPPPDPPLKPFVEPNTTPADGGTAKQRPVLKYVLWATAVLAMLLAVGLAGRIAWLTFTTRQPAGVEFAFTAPKPNTEYRPGDPGRYGFESGTEGWVAQTSSDSQACTQVFQSTKWAKMGQHSLEMKMDLADGDPHRSKGEAWVDWKATPLAGMAVPTDLTDQVITGWVYAPQGATGDRTYRNGFQLFVKDVRWRSLYGPWHNINIVGDWVKISMKVTESKSSNEYIDEGFDPHRITAIGVKMAAGEGSKATFKGSVFVDAVDW
ncbi:MAG: toll/interleukin-1 receptor domain-containing protein [Pirellulales bacterium]|nr:toll/interleukin-1 receptor domain-containing protein [Pirellulales bacterium]